MDSFDKSPLDAFVRSPLDARNAPGKRALFWSMLGNDVFSGSLFEDFMESIDVDVDYNSTFSGSIHDYPAIMFSPNFQGAEFPPWWDQFDSWSGRFLLYANGIGSTRRAGFTQRVNALSPKTGITANGFFDYGLTPSELAVLPHPLTEGMARGLNVGEAGLLVSGGTVVAPDHDALVVKDDFPGREAPLSVVASGWLFAFLTPIVDSRISPQLKSSAETFFKNCFTLPVGA